MAILAKSLLPLVSLDFVALTFFPAGHFLHPISVRVHYNSFEFIGWLKNRYLSIWDRDLLSRSGIASLTGLARLDLEGAETADLDIPAGFQALLDRFQQVVNCCRYIRPRKTCFLSNLFDQVSFGHGTPPH